MGFELKKIENKDLPVFKHDIQGAFQLGAAAWEEDLFFRFEKYIKRDE